MKNKSKKIIFSIILVVTILLSSFITVFVYLYVSEQKNPEHMIIEEIFDDEHINKLKSSHLKYKIEYKYDDGTTRESDWSNRHTEYTEFYKD